MAHKISKTTVSTTPVRGFFHSLRRGAPGAVLCLGVGAALVVGARTPKSGSAPVESSTVETSATGNIRTVANETSNDSATPLQIAKAQAAGFEKSDLSGVMVRHLPDAPKTQAKLQAGAGRVLRGTRGTPVITRNSYGVRKTAGGKIVLPNGLGTSRRIPSSLYPASRVEIVAGRVVRKCVVQGCTDAAHLHKGRAVSPKLAR